VGNTSPANLPKAGRPVHPHTRGEYGKLSFQSPFSHGSPPHTWGILERSSSFSFLFRFTPTHVGNTHWSAYNPGGFPVHPHTRGEYVLEGVSVPIQFGSPPHTWGILCLVLLIGRALRFTPTHVGKYPALALASEGGSGSPPHTWGIPHPHPASAAPNRFTPTHVGNTYRNSTNLIMPAVHPHTRGEYQAATGTEGAERGSPPHTWGIQHHQRGL